MIMFIAKKNDRNRHNSTGITVTNERDRVLTVITMLPGDNKDDDLEAMRFGNDEEGQQEGKSPQTSCASWFDRVRKVLRRREIRVK